MNGHEQVGPLAVREARAVAQGDEVVGIPGEQHLEAQARLDQLRHAAGDVEHQVLFREPCRPGGAQVVAAVAGVEHDRLQRSELLSTLARAPDRRPRDVEHDAGRIGQGDRTERPGGSLEDHPQHHRRRPRDPGARRR